MFVNMATGAKINQTDLIEAKRVVEKDGLCTVLLNGDLVGTMECNYLAYACGVCVLPPKQRLKVRTFLQDGLSL